MKAKRRLLSGPGAGRGRVLPSQEEEAEVRGEAQQEAAAAPGAPEISVPFHVAQSPLHKNTHNLYPLGVSVSEGPEEHILNSWVTEKEGPFG